MFKTYLVFNPNPNYSGDICVTLDRVDWGWNGYAAFDIANDKWVLVSGTNNAPVLTDTDEFPIWTDVYQASVSPHY